MIDFRKRVDRLLNHCMKTFGEEVTFYPQVGGVYKVRGVFDNDYESVDPDTEQLISSNQPAIGINLNDVKFEISQEDEIKVRETRYRIIDKREDGQGGALLLLHKIDATDKTIDTRVR